MTDQGPPSQPTVAPPSQPTVAPPAKPTAGPPTDPPPSSQSPPATGVRYKGEDLDAERGPGLGCFRFQLVMLVLFIVLTPLSVVWRWPEAVSTALLFSVILLLLVAGQTIIFLLRLVAADRRSRRRPLGSATKTVGELEDEDAAGEPGSGEPRNGEPRDGEPRDGG